MKKNFSLLAPISLICAPTLSIALDNAPSPSFKIYHIENVFNTAEKHSPHFTSEKSKKYKKTISYQYSNPANFSGHYNLIIWGCGTDCHQFAIGDKLTGNIYTDDSINFIIGSSGNDDPRIDYRKDSNLLIINGRINDKEEAKFFYLWKHNKLLLIKKTKLQKDEESQQTEQ